jgi:hypothetical protein
MKLVSSVTPGHSDLFFIKMSFKTTGKAPTMPLGAWLGLYFFLDLIIKDDDFFKSTFLTFLNEISFFCESLSF